MKKILTKILLIDFLIKIYYNIYRKIKKGEIDNGRRCTVI